MMKKLICMMFLAVATTAYAQTSNCCEKHEGKKCEKHEGMQCKKLEGKKCEKHEGMQCSHQCPSRCLRSVHPKSLTVA